jgi:exoribonuclease-2
VWQLVDDGLYFRGTPDGVVAATPDEVAAEEQARAARAAAARAWEAFVQRVAAGRYAPEDLPYLQEVEEVAYGRYEQSQVLRDLGRAETPENAHALLLALGYWDANVDPYPVRLGLPTTSPAVPLPPLPAEDRVDLTHLQAFAIDDAGSQDPDDAISLEIRPEGTRLWVHVADVAALVQPDSEADVIARARGASLYLPEGTVHMLPPEATERLALGLAETSPALSFAIDVSPTGEIAGSDVFASTVRVTRLTYAEAEANLEEAPLLPLYQLAQVLQQRREENGALSIDLPEVKVRVVDGRVAITPLPPVRSRDMVREAMLCAGEAIARLAQEKEIPIPFTVQDAPAVAETPGPGMAAQYALRRAFTRSQASTTAGPHGGLGLPVYAQATSPLRRYLDLVVHQQLRAFVHGQPLLDEAAILERVGAAEAVRGDVRYAERLANEHWTLVYLQQHPAWEGEAIVVEQYGQRSKVIIPELAYETQLYLRAQVPLNGTVRLGVGDVNLAERAVHFREL